MGTGTIPFGHDDHSQLDTFIYLRILSGAGTHLYLNDGSANPWGSVVAIADATPLDGASYSVTPGVTQGSGTIAWSLISLAGGYLTLGGEKR